MITSNSLEHNITNSTGRRTFYLTTAIAYMNGDPHIGHAYEVITSDAIVRLHRLLGYDTYFVTGADEHGQKVETAALKMNRTPQSHCDAYVSSFIELNKQLCMILMQSLQLYNRETEHTSNWSEVRFENNKIYQVTNNYRDIHTQEQLAKIFYSYDYLKEIVLHL